MRTHARHADAGVDKAEVAIIGDGQKGELSSHKKRFRNALLRSCYRHRKDEFKGGARSQRLAKAFHAAAAHCRRPETIKKLAAKLKRVCMPAYKKVFSVPAERQFPAIAIEKKYGPQRDTITGNWAEVRAQ